MTQRNLAALPKKTLTAFRRVTLSWIAVAASPVGAFAQSTSVTFGSIDTAAAAPLAWLHGLCKWGVIFSLPTFAMVGMWIGYEFFFASQRKPVGKLFGALIGLGIILISTAVGQSITGGQVTDSSAGNFVSQ